MHPFERTDKPMSLAAYDDDTRMLVRRLEEVDRKRSGHKLPVVRERIARRLGTVPGTIENLSRGRIKGVRSWLRQRIEALVIQELGHEIARLEADRAQLMASGHHLASQQMGEVDAYLKAVKALLGSARV